MYNAKENLIGNTYIVVHLGSGSFLEKVKLLSTGMSFSIKYPPSAK